MSDRRGDRLSLLRQLHESHSEWHRLETAAFDRCDFGSITDAVQAEIRILLEQLRVLDQDTSTPSGAAPAQTIVRQVCGIVGAERYCVLREAPVADINALVFACAGGPCSANGVTLAQACDLLVSAGFSEPDVSRLLDAARAGYRPL